MRLWGRSEGLLRDGCVTRGIVTTPTFLSAMCEAGLSDLWARLLTALQLSGRAFHCETSHCYWIRGRNVRGRISGEQNAPLALRPLPRYMANFTRNLRVGEIGVPLTELPSSESVQELGSLSSG